METSVSTNEFFPAQQYRDRNGACEVKTSAVGLTVGNNRTVITGVSGKITMIIRLQYGSRAAGESTGTFKSSNTRVIGYMQNATSAGLPTTEYCPEGLIKTDVGEDVTVDIGTNNAFLSFSYITYTP